MLREAAQLERGGHEFGNSTSGSIIWGGELLTESITKILDGIDRMASMYRTNHEAPA